MKARYIIRLDDACPTMYQRNWGLLEKGLDELGIRPIVGVVPDNRDPQLMHSPVDAGFWDRVRGWKSKGWSIALHGLHHTCHPIAPHDLSLLQFRSKSEFVGLSLEQQRIIVRKAWHQFLAERAHPTMFMAPSHTLDLNTLRALEIETDIRVIADGHACFPFRNKGFVWIPQQLWHFRSMPFGLWTVCLHPGKMNKSEIEAVLSTYARYRKRIIDPASIDLKYVPERRSFDYIADFALRIGLRLKALWRTDQQS